MHPTKKAAIALAGLWSIIAASWMAWHSLRPTPEKFARLLEQHPLSAATGPERTKIINHAASLLNGLDFEQRRNLRGNPVLRAFTDAMTQTERASFADLTMSDSVRYLAVEFNRMTELERRRAVKRLQREWNANADRAPDVVAGDDAVRLLSEGRETFMHEANSKVKADLAPLFAEIEASVPAKP